MNELEQEYGDRIEFLRYNVKDDAEAQCEFFRHNFQYTPSMIFIDKQGNIVETADKRQEKDQLKARLDNLLK